MEDAYVLITIGLSIFAAILVILGIGSYFGGDWNTVAQGVTQFILVIVAIIFAFFVLARLIGGRR